MKAKSERRCVWCGCTESRACPGGCAWAAVHPATLTGVCTRCVAKESAFRESAARQAQVHALACAIVNEAVESGFGNFWEKTWKPRVRVPVTLTIADVRMAAGLIKFWPDPEETRRVAEVERILMEMDEG